MIDPRGMALLDWADSMVLSLGDAWSYGVLMDEDRWQDWAIGLTRAYATRALPNPYEFSDWLDWAMRAYPMLETVT